MADNKSRTLVQLIECEDLWLPEIATEALESLVTFGIDTKFGPELKKTADNQE